jgi:2-oxoglutarate dehydrogenase E2 component (dihydrolipoamide succinyltransferase)
MPVIELKIPNLGESISSVTFSKWLKPDGSIVAMDEPLCEIETEKANQELSADSAGKLIHVAKEGEDLAVGALFAKIDTDASSSSSSSTGQSAAPAEKTVAATAPAIATATALAIGFPSPAAAKILAEGNLNPADVTGTGRDGRITKDDAMKAVASGVGSSTSSGSSQPTTTSNPQSPIPNPHSPIPNPQSPIPNPQ